MKIYSFLFIFLFFVSCNSKSKTEDSKFLIVDRMVCNFSPVVAPKGLKIIGIGGGLDHAIEKQNLISVVLDTDEEMSDLTTARKLLVETIIEFLDFINSKEEIKKYLSVSPLTIENIEVGILFNNSKPGQICNIFNIGTRLCYYEEGDHPNKLTSKKLLEEKFEDALLLVSQKG